jgi:glycopeptide antibiotics resistance protein
MRYGAYAIMGYLILTGYELLTVLLPFIVVATVSGRKDKRNNRQNSSKHFLALCVFMIYVFAMLHFTGAGTIFDLFRYESGIFQEELNFMPFTNYINQVEYFQNILLFIPLGFILPMIWPHTNKFKYALLSGLSFSLCIEISQLLNHRATDIDDLIVNTAGALLGYLSYRIFARITKLNNKRTNYPHNEPYIYATAMFAGHFLLYNQFGLASIIYGF